MNENPGGRGGGVGFLLSVSLFLDAFSYKSFSFLGGGGGFNNDCDVL